MIHPLQRHINYLVCEYAITQQQATLVSLTCAMEAVSSRILALSGGSAEDNDMAAQTLATILAHMTSSILEGMSEMRILRVLEDCQEHFKAVQGTTGEENVQ